MGIFAPGAHKVDNLYGVFILLKGIQSQAIGRITLQVSGIPGKTGIGFKIRTGDNTFYRFFPLSFFQGLECLVKSRATQQ